MIYLLIGGLLFLAIVTFVQIIRVSELLSKIRNKDVNEVTENDNNIQGKILLVVGFGFLVFVIWQIVAWKHLILPPASSLHGVEIDSLMNTTMMLILVVFFITSIILFFFGFKYRGIKGRKAFFYAHNNKLEIVWTIVPAIVLSGLIVSGLKVWDSTMNVTSENSQIIELHSRQFQWAARYAGEDNILGKHDFRLIDRATNPLSLDKGDKYTIDDKITNEVHLVVGKPVMLKFRSDDVIHSAYIPHFRVQMNCVPGVRTQFGFTPTKTTQEMREDPQIIRQMQELNDRIDAMSLIEKTVFLDENFAKTVDDLPLKFDYQLLCNKICGSAHYNMKMKFVVETQEEFDTWIAQQKEVGGLVLTKK
ncbi:MAG: cytochrome C oxidase subunit II [Flavobacteriales bacterium]|nr:cytochrome C oxidase subunit II [Flavobacteriales bacterium]|tara:strand:+ start:87 stop:1175 length:1089 start_codon:yes stop_codon:yes gene_type:complete